MVSRFLLPALVMLPLLAAGGCETATLGKPNQPARLLFLVAETQEDRGTYAEALTNYQKIIDENPGTLLATFSHLKIAEVKFRQEEWVEAETQYRLFLTLNPNTHLTPFILSRLMEVNHKKSFTGVLFKGQEVDRDMGPNRQLILEFKRFFLLYPKSGYVEEGIPLYRAARETLARHELLVGDFYFDRGQFHSAIGRYQFLLKQYPEFKGQREVLVKLIRAYRQNQQPALQREMEHIYQLRFGEPAPTAGSLPETALLEEQPRGPRPDVLFLPAQ